MTDAPKLNRPTYWAWITDPTNPDLDPVPHLVVVNAGDQLRAELEAHSHGIKSAKDAPMHLTALWLWAAMVRTGDYSDKFRAFKDELIAWDVPDDEKEDDDSAGDVVPTEARSS